MKAKIVFEENKLYETREMDIDQWVEKNIEGTKPYIDYDLDTLSASRIKINTQDTYLPYQILTTDELIIKAPNLKTCENFPIHGLSNATISIEFNDTYNLDISCLRFYIEPGLDKLKFSNIPTFNPQSLKNIPITQVICMGTNSPHVFDINNYVHLQVEMIILKEVRIDGFKNLSTFFDNLLGINSFKIDSAFILSNINQKLYEKLNGVLVKYFNNNKSMRIDYSMDATLTLIEAGFEDML